MKGAKSVTATSPQGVVVTYTGVCLYIARECDSGQHFTVHEITENYALVAIIPQDWAIGLERNQ